MSDQRPSALILMALAANLITQATSGWWLHMETHCAVQLAVPLVDVSEQLSDDNADVLAGSNVSEFDHKRIWSKTHIHTHTHIHSHTHAAWPVPPRDTSHHITHLPRYRQARGLWATETGRMPTSMAEGTHPNPQASLPPRNSLATHGWCHETPSWIGSRPQLSPAGTLPDLSPARTWHGACCTHSQRRHVSHSQWLVATHSITLAAVARLPLMPRKRP